MPNSPCNGTHEGFHSFVSSKMGFDIYLSCVGEKKWKTPLKISSVTCLYKFSPSPISLFNARERPPTWTDTKRHPTSLPDHSASPMPWVDAFVSIPEADLNGIWNRRAATDLSLSLIFGKWKIFGLLNIDK